jgi:hypothetical protein
MSNDVAVRSSQLANIEAAAQEDAGFEKILKFKKGEYFIGEDEIALGTEFLAHTVGWVKCWIKFLNGEVAERKLYRVALGERPPLREDLDCRDEDEWPAGLDDEPADPWVFQYLLPLENLESGEVVIFVTSSFGGRRAIADLCDGYTKRAKKARMASRSSNWRRRTLCRKNSAKYRGHCLKSSTGTVRRWSLSRHHQPYRATTFRIMTTYHVENTAGGASRVAFPRKCFKATLL